MRDRRDAVALAANPWISGFDNRKTRIIDRHQALRHVPRKFLQRASFPYKKCIFSGLNYLPGRKQMEVVTCISVLCSRPFQVNRFTTELHISYPRGIIKCPHCGTSSESSPDSLFLTHALSMEEEAQFGKSPEPVKK